MEVHAPHKPVESVREMLVHLLIVTIGILIALSLEQTVEWFHHRELAREARENIVSEIRDNQKELGGNQKMVPGLLKNQLEVLTFIRDVTDHGKSDIRSLQLTFHLAELRNTSWATAQSVGALVYLPYADVKRYARVYQLQDEYVRLQARTLDSVASAMTAFSEKRDPATLSRPELEAERIRVEESISALTVQSQIGEGLSRAYNELFTPAAVGGSVR